MNSRFEIVPMNASEAGAVSALLVNVLSTYEHLSPPACEAEARKYTPSELRKLITEDPYSILVARADDEIVGLCVSSIDNGLVWVSWIVVDPKQRRQGISAMLLRALESSLAERGAHKLWCDCRTTNTASQRLLNSAGYSQICTVNNHWYGYDYILWERVP